MHGVLIFSTILMLVKIWAWSHTHSDAILTDAAESLVNVLAGAFTLFCVIYSLQPKDEGHPYGHGKIEYIAAGTEGALIFLAGISMLGNSIYGLFIPPRVEKIWDGVTLTIITGSLNGIVGWILVRNSKKHFSAALEAEGKHLLSDAISSLGLLLGLILVAITEWLWIDHFMALIFSMYILFTGYKVLKKSLESLLDSADNQVLTQMVAYMENNREPAWIDIHQFRVQKFGDSYHVDAHVTLPWYYSLKEAHEKVRSLEIMINNAVPQEIELFIHSDPCTPIGCSICTIENCPNRIHPFIEKVTWTLSTLLPDHRHGVSVYS